MEELRSRVRKFMYALGAIPILFILLKFLFFLIGIDRTSVLINFIYSVADIFIVPFKGLVVDVVKGTAGVEFTALVAIVAWIGIIIVITELVTSFMYETIGEILVNVIDVIFKFIEFFLLVRLLASFFGIKAGANELLDVIYAIAGIVYTPFSGIAPGIPIGSGGMLEISTLVALIIVAAVDYVSDGILSNIFLGEKKEKPVAAVTNVNVGQPPQVNVYVPESQPQMPQITINQVPATRADQQIAVRMKNYQGDNTNG